MKLQAGEYVSLGKVEAELATNKLVENICIYGESSKHFVVALIVPNQKAFKELTTSIGVEGEFEDLCSNEKVVKAFHQELVEQAKRSRLQKFEIPEKITLCKEIWATNNGLLTAAFKIKRRDIQLKYQDDINRMYKS